MLSDQVLESALVDLAHAEHHSELGALFTTIEKDELENVKRYPFDSQGNSLMALKMQKRASLVAQWLRICLPMQGTRVRALVWEDPTCRGATRPVSHNY